MSANPDKRLVWWDRLPVWMHAIWAWVGGYFWMKCERCGRHFGGHQWRIAYKAAQNIPVTLGEGRCAYCPRCAVARDRWEPGWYEGYLKVVWYGSVPAGLDSKMVGMLCRKLDPYGRYA